MSNSSIYIHMYTIGQAGQTLPGFSSLEIKFKVASCCFMNLYVNCDSSEKNKTIPSLPVFFKAVYQTLINFFLLNIVIKRFKAINTMHLIAIDLVYFTLDFLIDSFAKVFKSHLAFKHQCFSPIKKLKAEDNSWVLWRTRPQSGTNQSGSKWLTTASNKVKLMHSTLIKHEKQNTKTKINGKTS